MSTSVEIRNPKHEVTTPAGGSARPSGAWMKDLSASLVVFLVALPLCMGIALASGMPPASGLVTGIIGGLVVGFLSGQPLQVSGPAAGLAVIVFEMVREHGVAALGPILMVAGAIQLVAGLLKTGRWFRAISPEVIHGMLAGIGVLIVIQQFHVVLDRTPEHSGPANIKAMWGAIFGGLFPLNGSKEEAAALVGLITIVVMVLWERFRPAKLKLVPSALLGIVTATATAQIFAMSVNRVKVPENLGQMISLPHLSSMQGIGLSTLAGTALALAFIASAETLLSAAAVDQMQTRHKTNYDRELMAQGVGNMLCGFVGSLPMTGVIVRSSANVQAGAETRRSAILHGVWMLMSVVLFASVLRMIPTASLAAVLILVGIKLVKPAEIRKLARFGKIPVLIYFASMITIVSTDLLTGVMVGVGLSLLRLLYTVTHLDARVEEQEGATHVHLSGIGTFLAIPRIAQALDEVKTECEVHIHCVNLRYIDHACIEVIEGWTEQREQNGQQIHIEMEKLHMRYRAPVSETVS
ncbi:MAG: SulP family inorganic anion transporter [Edaphobacter sp.]|uniref:SulP family inorganic anion transporter n=1 Tax=Edaphobacter sp. TaxID=1934404 RepID=UPI0023948901|nr:SulP family inorganic anion transporter [Edaphobacter sp.]MDE1177223.1 SulP family inorganic anion transporter [Edaphobacter sp.]